MARVVNPNPFCAPTLLPEPEPEGLTAFPHLNRPMQTLRFALGGWYKQNTGGGFPAYHSYLVNVIVPPGMVMVIDWAGFDDFAFAKYDMWVNGTPDATIWDIGRDTWTYDEVNPPGAPTYTGKAYALCETDGAVSGLCGCMRLESNPIIIDQNASVRLRGAVSTALKTCTAWIRGYYLPKPGAMGVIN